MADEAAATQAPGGGGRLHLGLVRWIDHRIERLEDKLEVEIRDLRREVDGLAGQIDTRFTASEAKIDDRFASWGAKVETRFAASEARSDERLTRVDQRFAAMQAQIDSKGNVSIALMVMLLVAVLGKILFPHL